MNNCYSTSKTFMSNTQKSTAALSMSRTRNIPLRIALGVFLGSAAVLLCGCAQVSSVQPGTPVADVIRKFGRPVVTCAQPDGSRRMVWTQQPEGETAFALTVGPDKLVGTPEQVLDDKHFSILSNGQAWTAEKVRCQFGPPANITGSGLDHSRQVIWGYRYMKPGSDAAMMYIYMGIDGTMMTHYISLPDPDRNEEVMGGGH
jgi:hypothetical protein